MVKTRYPSLPVMLLQDLTRFKWVIALAIAVIGSALTVIYTAHQNRLLTSERDELLSTQDRIDREWRHLVLEQTALTEHSRVERIAQEQLGMIDVDAKHEVLVPWQ
ncbi:MULTISPECIES: cell division protein FtsL [unclassified Idiomarina]|jgi:cell division protein FtsL|uniref:cell division protein FtsL n=1 Tax=unclassified Idiomarina TaxID=2614829 RepID=UPI0008F87E98|nr:MULTISPECIES: cell division protein FtsL [unclassified Idiomarina]MAD52615.1 cell division protein FtsL [Idiomarinaceae bacterium]MEC7643877.1 cell division protein FtsL [Pseudomonadota bacterium]NQZ03311.1 cell division protein FtsL [Idiomarina sp.]OIM99308.1 cell division protein FtsL [Idiomarina sp. MD25a]|tara:strand:- start:8767 stop:9084 length:318 start_codon:yes stop_codon:yes gene_type:complete